PVCSWVRHAADLDFETLPIEPRPRYPPLPVGVAIRVPGRKPRYYAWGHPSGNNCTFEEARAAVGEVWQSERPILGHNVAKFDHEVARVHMGLPGLPWERLHDTLPMLFLNDPRATDYQLKPSAERLLGLPPEEQDAVLNWLVEHQPIPGK